MSHESIALLIGWFLGIPAYHLLIKPYADKYFDKKYPK